MIEIREQLIRRALLAMSEVDQSSRGEGEARACVEAVIDDCAVPEMAELLEAIYDEAVGAALQARVLEGLTGSSYAIAIEDHPSLAKIRALLTCIKGESDNG